MAFNEETNMYDGFIYKIVNNINDKVYIGQTRINIETRWKQHIRDINDDCKIHKAMSKYGKENFSILPIQIIHSINCENLIEELNKAEKYWIKYYNSYENGYNLTLGGDNAIHLKDEVPVLCYDFSNFNDVKITEYSSMAEASRRKNIASGIVSICCSYKIHYLKNKHLVFRYKTDPLSDKQIENYKIKYPIIYKYNFNGILLETFRTVKDAALSLSSEINRTININSISGNIREACTTDNTSAYGYIWRKYPYTFDSFKIPANKMIEQHSIFTGELINKYDSIVEASKQTGANAATISLCCGTYWKNHRAGDFYWCFENEWNDEILKENNHKKPVSKYTKQGKFICTYDSIDIAGNANNISPSKIGSCCNGNRKTAANFVWRFANDPFNKYNSSSNKNREINMYSKENIYLKTFQNVQIAGRELNKKDVTGIYKCCKGEMKTSLGYKWFYANDKNQPDKTKIIA